MVHLAKPSRSHQQHEHVQPKVLANLTGMPYYAFGKFRDFENGAYGVAVLSRYPIEHSQIFHYTKPSSFIREGDAIPDEYTTPLEEMPFVKTMDTAGQKMNLVCEIAEEGDFCQGAVAILVRSGSVKIWFVTTHLGEAMRILPDGRKLALF